MNNPLESTVFQDNNVNRWSHLLRRVAAYAVDLAVAFGVFVGIQSFLFPLISRRYGPAFTASGWLLELYVVATISLPVWLYFILLERSRWRATIGKRLFGLQVAAVSGAELSSGQVVMRTVGKLLPWELAHFAVNVPTNPWMQPDTVFSTWRVALIGIVYVLLFLYLIAVARRPQQTVYDRLAGTAVIRATEPAE